jgi:glycosyltransferase involved in cell wall biosynthesis
MQFHRLKNVSGNSEAPPKICLLAATALTVHFFLKPHLLELSKNYDVTLALNPVNDIYLPDLALPIEISPIDVARKISPWQDFIALFQLIKLFKSKRFDLLVTVVPKAGLLGMIAGFLVGIPRRLHIFQGEVWASKTGALKILLKLADRVTATLATHVLAVSSSERQFLIEEGIVSADKILVLGNGSICGVNLDRYHPRSIEESDEARRSFGIPEDAIVVIFLGRLVPDKGINDFASACRDLEKSCQNLWILLVGPDEECVINSVLGRMGEIKNRTKVFGFTSEPEKYIAAADFICLPSHREGFGVVLIEAGAMGLPAIGSKIYGISDAIINDKTGILFDKGDVIQLQNAIHRLYSDASLRYILGNAASEYVRKSFDSKDVVHRYIEYINNLIRSN